MAFSIDKYGNISLIQGDSGTITISGLNTDKNYTIYFAIQNKNRETVASELQVSSNHSSFVIFKLTAEYTDLLTVKKNEDFAIYYYGIKMCNEESQKEDTVLIGGSQIGDKNRIIVFPKKVEGGSNGRY